MLLFVFLSLIMLRSQQSRMKLARHTKKLWSVLLPGKYAKYQCDLCLFYFMSKKDQHFQNCRSKPALRKWANLQLAKSQGAFCHLGCDVKTKRVSLRHLYEAHSAEELRPWSISRDLIKILLDGHQKIPTEFIISKLDTGQSEHALKELLRIYGVNYELEIDPAYFVDRFVRDEDDVNKSETL